MDNLTEEKPENKMTYLGKKKWDGPELRIGDSLTNPQEVEKGSMAEWLLERGINLGVHSDMPLEGAEVALWKDGRIVARGLTDKDGRVTLELVELKKEKPDSYRHIVGLIKSLLK